MGRDAYARSRVVPKAGLTDAFFGLQVLSRLISSHSIIHTRTSVGISVSIRVAFWAFQGTISVTHSINHCSLKVSSYSTLLEYALLKFERYLPLQLLQLLDGSQGILTNRIRFPVF